MNDRGSSPPPSAGRLAGFRIGLLEARLASEAASLVQRWGGTPVSAPALREEPLPAGDAVGSFLDKVAAGELSFVVLQTGAGVVALFEEARLLDREAELRAALGRLRTVSRGPKPAAALAAKGLRAKYSVPAPYTTSDLLGLLEALPVGTAGVGLVHYGERNRAVVAALRSRGARVEELTLYEWRLPEDTLPLKGLIDELLGDRLDAVAFTTQVQVRHLFELTEQRLHDAVVDALDKRVVTGAVGPTCAEALRVRGIKNVVVPENPKLGPMFAALASRLVLRRAERSEARGDR